MPTRSASEVEALTAHYRAEFLHRTQPILDQAERDAKLFFAKRRVDEVVNASVAPADPAVQPPAAYLHGVPAWLWRNLVEQQGEERALEIVSDPALLEEARGMERQRLRRAEFYL